MKDALALIPALAALVVVAITAPGYMTEMGFPLDESWANLVYGRSFAENLTLSFNPGEPDLGAPSPLWAIVLGVPHALSDDFGFVLQATKFLGFALHLATVICLVFVFREDRVLSSLVAIVVGMHPDLVAASVSGTYVPLATFLVAVMLLGITKKNLKLFGLASLLAVATRPELAILSLSLPVFAERDSKTPAMFLAGAATSGVILLVLACLSFWWTDAFVPSSLEADYNLGVMALHQKFWLGRAALLKIFLVNATAVLICVTAWVTYDWLSSSETQAPLAVRLALLPGALLTLVLLCGSSHPTQLTADQTRLLMTTPLLICGLIWAMLAAIRTLENKHHRWIVAAAASVLLALSATASSVQRYERLASDVENHDALQVQQGLYLAEAENATVWTEAGATIRYLSPARVIDLTARYTSMSFGGPFAAHLEANPPTMLEVAPPLLLVSLSTEYSPPAETWEAPEGSKSRRVKERSLIGCPPGAHGALKVASRGLEFDFRCSMDMRRQEGE